MHWIQDVTIVQEKCGSASRNNSSALLKSVTKVLAEEHCKNIYVEKIYVKFYIKWLIVPFKVRHRKYIIKSTIIIIYILWHLMKSRYFCRIGKLQSHSNSDKAKCDQDDCIKIKCLCNIKQIC